MPLKSILKKNLSFILIIIIVVLISVSYLFVWPKYQSYQSIKKEFDLKDEETEAKEEYLPKLEAISQRLTTYSKQIEIVEKALPSNPSVASLYEYLKKVSSENGLIVNSIDALGLYAEADEEEIGLGTKEMLFSMTVAGSYESFKLFLMELYLNERIIEVKSVSLSSGLTVEPGDSEEEIVDEELVASSSENLVFKLDLKTQSYSENNTKVNVMPSPMAEPPLE